MSELLPCPFCGGNFVAQGASRGRISVWCGSCGAQGPDVDFPEICIDPAKPIDECRAAWNRRTSNSYPKLVEALARQIDNMAFIINHVTLPNQWREKFMRELDEDRAALSLTQEKADA